MSRPPARLHALPGPDAAPVVCADVGSTYTKALAVDTATGTLLATAEHRTTVDADVLTGLDACQEALSAALGGAALGEPLVCSSAGGGLRLAVVGYEPLVTAEAGHQVGLSAGARVVHVAGGRLDGAGVAALRAAAPDVVLLVGGTDGGDAEVIGHNAARLAATRLRVPVVLAGNAEVADALAATLTGRGVPVTVAANVLPRIGVLQPAAARAAIRATFLRHVIGGKHLSRGPRFASLVRGATPDLVLAGVEALADGTPQAPGAGPVVVVDIGGATTDVYSVLTPDAEATGPRRAAAGHLWRSRTVEGDLGMRWTAPGIVAAAETEALLNAGQAAALAEGAQARAAAPGLLPDGPAESALDARLAALAATVALRRHARGTRRADGSRGPGRDLRPVRLVVGSGGVLRHAGPGVAQAVLDAAVGDHAGGYPLPRAAARTLDTRYVLAAAGLLAAEHPDAAARLAATLHP